MAGAHQQPEQSNYLAEGHFLNILSCLSLKRGKMFLFVFFGDNVLDHIGLSLGFITDCCPQIVPLLSRPFMQT